MTNLGPATSRATGFRAMLPRWSPRLAIGLGLVGAIALSGIHEPATNPATARPATPPRRSPRPTNHLRPLALPGRRTTPAKGNA